ncbi:MAG: hypothetical protein ACJ8AT_38255 [Hyalangium sp.]|uniref:hypothetical protein n=1 Tax=Hyalangium sp. TaxID=2028555 RepID=UPI00389AABF9
MSQVNLEDREIANERLELGSGVVYFLGPNLTLRNCTLVLGVSARNLIIPQARLLDCTVIIKRELMNFRWESAHLKGCRFKGRFTGNDFGEWSDAPGEGSIEDCDFSEATLHATRFLGCDARTIRFPSWPCFTLFDSVRRARELSALPWPGTAGRIEMQGFERDPPSTVALTYSAVEIAKRRGTTPEAIKALIENLDGVYY